MNRTEEAFEMLCAIRNGEEKFVVVSDLIAMCLFGEHPSVLYGDKTPDPTGFRNRQTVRSIPGVFREANGVETFEDFEALIARLKMEHIYGGE